MNASFDEIAGEFDRRIRRVVWCSAATIDTKNRTRTRIVHPIWEGRTGWITSRRGAPKGRHLAHNPHLSLSYPSGPPTKNPKASPLERAKPDKGTSRFRSGGIILVSTRDSADRRIRGVGWQASMVSATYNPGLIQEE